MDTTEISRSARWQPLSGIAFVMLFIGGVVASSPPSDSASDARWIADYTGTAHKAGHVASGVCLVLAGLCLLVFIQGVWTRIGAVSGERKLSPLPVLAAGVAAAAIGVGGVLMGASVVMVSNSFTPSADLLRFCNDVGFAMVALAGMIATALSLAVLTAQGRAVGYFGSRMTIFGFAVAVVLLAAIEFIPIAALLLWLLIVSLRWLRNADGITGPSPLRLDPAPVAT